MKFNTDKKIQVTLPSFKKINEKIKDIPVTNNFIITALICIIAIVIPCLFLPYVYNYTNQLSLTYFFTIIAILGIIILKIYTVFKEKRKNNEKTDLKHFKLPHIGVIDIVFAIYSILIAISTFTSRYYPFTVLDGLLGRAEGMITLYLYITIFYLVYKFYNYNSKILPYLATSSMIVSFVGILQAVLYYILLRTDEYIFMGFSSFGNPNFFSSYLTLVLPIFIITYIKKGNPFYLITSLISFGALVCTKTLSGYIAFLIYFTIIVIWALLKHLDKKKIVYLIIGIVCVFSILNLCAQGKYFDELISIVYENPAEQKDDFGSGRGLVYKIGLDIMKKYPILGIGPDSLGGHIYINYAPTDMYTSDKLFDKAHCEYLQIAVCTGIPSLICYIAAIGIIGITMLKRFFKDTDNTVIFAVGISILAYLIQAITNISVTHVAPIFWIMLGIGYGMCKDKNTYTKKNNS